MKTYGDGTYGAGTYGEPSISMATDGKTYSYAVGASVSVPTGSLWFAHRFVGDAPDDDQTIFWTPNCRVVIDDDIVASCTIVLAFDQACTVSAPIPEDGLWHHVAFAWSVTASGFTITVYIDGVEIASQSEPVEEAQAGDGAAYALNGPVPDGCEGHRVYELALWSVATDAAAITEGMLALVGNEAGLEHLWRGDEESGNSASDLVTGQDLVEAIDPLWAGRTAIAEADCESATAIVPGVFNVLSNPSQGSLPEAVAVYPCSVTVTIIHTGA